MNARIYIAGPMAGYDHHNFPAFERAAAWLRARDWDVVSPHEIHVAQSTNEAAAALGYRYFMQSDLPALMTCGALALLKGWSRSRGANCELTVARTCGLHLFQFVDDFPVRDYRELIELID